MYNDPVIFYTDFSIWTIVLTASKSGCHQLAIHNKIYFSSYLSYFNQFGSNRVCTRWRHEGIYTHKPRSLTPTLSAWLLRIHWALKSILRQTLFLDQLHDSSLLSLNSFYSHFWNRSSCKLRKHSSALKKNSFWKPDFYKPINTV